MKYTALDELDGLLEPFIERDWPNVFVILFGSCLAIGYWIFIGWILWKILFMKLF